MISSIKNDPLKLREAINASAEDERVDGVSFADLKLYSIGQRA